jgi:hypothetical protein
VVSLVAAALAPERLGSLTVIEPPAFGLVRGDPSRDELRLDLDSLSGHGLRLSGR